MATKKIDTPLPRRIEYMPLTDIKPHPNNPKTHDQPGIERSISRYGLAEVPLLDERTGQLVAGHGRLNDLLTRHAQGQTPPDGVHVNDTGEWMIPVIRGWASRSDAEADAYLIASNQLTINGGWDEKALNALLGDLAAADYELALTTGYNPDELAALLDLVDEQNPDDTDLDELPDNVPSIARPGDLWLLGPHRLACGDSTSDSFLRFALGDLTPGIVYTDPPYGISIVRSNGKIDSGGPVGGKAKGKVGSGKVVAANDYLPVAGDDTTDAARDAFALLTTTFPEARQVWWGGNHYAGSAALPDSSCWLVWDKENGTNHFADAELAWTNYPGAVRIFRHMWNGMLRASEREKRVHPTQKPVALAQWAFGVVDPQAKEDVVLDVFGGSGSTLIAAHETKRTAVIVEMEPHYVDVICRRWQGLTGELPQRYSSEGSPEPVDFS